MSDLKSTNRAPREFREPGDVADTHDTEVFFLREHVEHAFREFRSRHDFGVIFNDHPGSLFVYFAVEGDGSAESRQTVGHVGPVVRLRERAAFRHTAGVVVLDNDRAGGVHEVTQDIERVVGVGDVDFPGVFARLEQFDIRGEILSGCDAFDFPENEVAVDKAIERRFLAGILAVPEPLLHIVDQPRNLLEGQRLAPVVVDERDLHAGRKMVVHDGFVSAFEILCRHEFLPKGAWPLYRL